MALTINTNVGAMAALQNLTATNNQLATVQSRINTGLSVASTKDDSASYVIAQKLRGDIQGLKAVGNSLSRAKSVTDVAIAGAEQISDLLIQMNAKATEASGAVDDKSRAAINRDFVAYRDTLATIVKSTDFNGTNLLKTGGGDVKALLSIQDSDAAVAGYQTDTLVVDNVGLDLGGAVIAVTAATDLGVTDVTSAAAKTLVEDSQTAMAVKLSELGAAARRLDTQISFNTKLSDTITAGIGSLVDADMAKESASLQALQVKQQLGVQALSIANQAPQTILSLFR